VLQKLYHLLRTGQTLVGGQPFARLRRAVWVVLVAVAGCGQTQDCDSETPDEACPCADGLERCAGTCVDLSADESHCAACGTACSAAQTCASGSCQCEAGTSLCGASCVRLETDTENCGACDNACAAGASCHAGACACPAGTTDCGDTCSKLDEDRRNCGSCGSGCAASETCLEGSCFSDVGDDCGGRARNVNISSVSLFQSVEAALFADGVVVEPSARDVDIIQQKSALVRVHVDVLPGFAARQLSARVSLQNGAGAPVFVFAKQRVNKDSQQYLLDSTLNVEIPAELIQSDTRYHVELVECGDVPDGDTQTTRIPALGEADLGARRTGPIKVAFVPFRFNGILPDTSNGTLQGYIKDVIKQFGTPAVETEVLPELGPYSGEVDMDFLLDEVLARRASDSNVADDVYYYGLIKPNATFDEYCTGACTEGIAYIPEGDPKYRVGMGIAFEDAESAATLAHELGHNHERDHAPCGDFSDTPDLDYPYPFQSLGGGSYSGARIGKWGYDALTHKLKDPDQFSDLMGYCGPTWISDYTYNGVNDVIADAQKAAFRRSASFESWDILRVTRKSAYWLAFDSEERTPSKGADVGVAYDADGSELERFSVYRFRVSDGGGYRLLVPPRQPGWSAVGLLNDLVVPYP